MNLFFRLKQSFLYYTWASYRRKMLDKLLSKYESCYSGIVLDIGGRDRGIFRKPKDKVEKWIFVDIEKEHNPDIVLDVADMQEIKSDSINTINAIELFEHVENPEKGLAECFRVLKKNGNFIISTPFLLPVHADPYDFQRWTDEKWMKVLEGIGFQVEIIEIMGRYFTSLAETLKAFVKSLPHILRRLGYIMYPLFDLIASIDRLDVVQKHQSLGKFHGGYFIICKK